MQYKRVQDRLEMWVVALPQVSQFELYSSRIKDFQLRARLKHPRSDGADYAKSLDSPNWQLLGNFTAAKAKGTQTFKARLGSGHSPLANSRGSCVDQVLWPMVSIKQLLG